MLQSSSSSDLLMVWSTCNQMTLPSQSVYRKHLWQLENRHLFSPIASSTVHPALQVSSSEHSVSHLRRWASMGASVVSERRLDLYWRARSCCLVYFVIREESCSDTPFAIGLLGEMSRNCCFGVFVGQSFGMYPLLSDFT